MKKFQPTLEHAIYFLALLIAIGFRFINLGALPLSDYEASWALQALRLTQGLKPAIGPNPAYVHLTTVLFALFGPTNFLARFWPALAGTALVLAPWFLRRRLGRIAAILLAFGLAIDPGLVGLSHLAGGPMLAVTLLVFTGLMWMDRRFALAGLFAGLALLSGTAIWFGLLGLLFTWAFVSLLGSLPSKATEEPAMMEEPLFPAMSSPDLRKFLAWGIGTLLVVGSLLVLSPGGLAAFVQSFLTFGKGWWTLSGVQLWQPALAMPAYEILPLGFGIAGLVRGIIRRDRLSITLGVWAVLAFVLVIVYPGKQVGDLAWSILPLWALTALELAHHFDFEGRNLWELAGTLTVVLILLIFGWLNATALTNMDLTTSVARTRLWLLLAVFLLILLSLLLVWTGWSAAVARLGGVWGALIFLGLFTVAMSTGTAGLRQPLVTNLWAPEPRTGRADIILKVANEISDLNRGQSADLGLTILNMPSPALHWLFRDWKVTDVNQLASDTKPEMVITPATADQPSLAAGYRGEPLVLAQVPDWSHATSTQWLTWVIYRQMPMLNEQIDLWVRSDLMLDNPGTQNTQP